ncbi:MAG: methyltransferase domain-containing protein [Betaproteobacteria bacterium]
MKIIKQLGLTFLVCVFSSAGSYAQTLGDDKYQPFIGQSGKDVVWVPSPDQLIDKMLKTAKVTEKDIVFDLGAGDGKIAIAAALNYGAKSTGIEFNPEMAALAQRNVERAGLKDKVRIINGDIFVEDFSSATVVTLYLLPELNLKLKPILQKMKPGTRVVSNSFTMGEWEADEVIESDRGRGYFWIIPAIMNGEWNLQLAGKTAQLSINQRDQKFTGTLKLGGETFQVINGLLRASDFTFEYQRPDRSIVKVSGTIEGATIKAQQQILSAAVMITGQRK